jgi:lysophospholipase L1-like esterase
VGAPADSIAGPVNATRAKGLRRWAPRLALVAASLAMVEFAARTQVPACDLTPFRNSAVPGLSVELRPGFETLYKGHRVSINAAGLRGPELGERDPASIRIAVVGDSFAFGTGVDLEGTLSSQLQRALTDAGRSVEVLNFGVPGYTSTNVAAVVEHKALELRPDVVLYVFFANDIEPPTSYGPIPPDARIDPLKAFPLRSAGLEGALVLVKRLALSFGFSLARRSPSLSTTEYETGAGARLREAFERIRGLCAARGVEFRLAVYPFLTRVDLNQFRPIDELALADAARLGIRTVDLLDAFAGERDLTHYWVSLFDGHPNADANAKVAAFLASWLSDSLDERRR